jgi:hypothetical protein
MGEERGRREAAVVEVGWGGWRGVGEGSDEGSRRLEVKKQGWGRSKTQLPPPHNSPPGPPPPDSPPPLTVLYHFAHRWGWVVEVRRCEVPDLVGQDCRAVLHPEDVGGVEAGGKRGAGMGKETEGKGKGRKCEGLRRRARESFCTLRMWGCSYFLPLHPPVPPPAPPPIPFDCPVASIYTLSLSLCRTHLCVMATIAPWNSWRAPVST